MEWSPACGVLGVPISLQCQSQTGPVCCSVTQLFAKVILDIPHALLLPEEADNNCDTNTESLRDVNLDVEFSEDSIVLKNSNGNVAIEAHPWGTLAPQSCQWHHSTEDRSIHITLAKAPASLGSWPYSFQSLVLFSKMNNTNITAEEQKICNYDKIAFNKQADALLASHIAESRALKTAFAHAIAEQMRTLPCGPLGQSAFLFPQQGPHCFAFLKACYSQNIPSVRKLVRIAYNLTGIILIEEEGEEEKEEETAEVEAFPSSSFYSLRSLVGCLIAGLAAVEQYRHLHGLDAIKSITACIGFGAGEYAAAVFAGALRLQDALVAVKAHAQAFNEIIREEQQGYHNRSFEEVDDIEECRSRAIDAVRAALLSRETPPTPTENNIKIHSTSTTSITTTTKPKPSQDIDTGEISRVRCPRVRMYSGADGVVYDGTSSTSIFNALPFGVCAGHALVSHRHNVRVALMQQGVAEMTVLVPEEGDEKEEEEREEEEEEEVGVVKVLVDDEVVEQEEVEQDEI